MEVLTKLVRVGTYMLNWGTQMQEEGQTFLTFEIYLFLFSKVYIFFVFRLHILARTLHLIQFSPHFSGIADTCVAMDDWLQNPPAHTVLSQILPCVDNATAYGTLSTSKDMTFQTVSNVNKFITNVANKNGTGPNSFSQSGPLVPALCNRYHSDMTDRKCITGEVDFSNADAVCLNYRHVHTFYFLFFKS